MAFSEETIKEAWDRSEEQCECERKSHGHHPRCTAQLIWEHQGRTAKRPGRWEAHHKVSVEAGGEDITSNCEILCWGCHSLTFKTS